MPLDSIRDQDRAVAQTHESVEGFASVQEHVKEIIEGKAFRGSDRCGRFLAYIVDQAITGHFESLKERVIGVEVFGRPPDYSTSEDAIVRVTASDIRKRLERHYRKNGTISSIHIALPVGSYIPEIICDSQSIMGAIDTRNGRLDPPVKSPIFSMPRQTPELFPITAQNPSVEAHAVSLSETVLSKRRFRLRSRTLAVTLAVLVMLLAVLSLSLLGIVRKDRARVNAAALSVLPWSALFSSQHPTHLITSDPDIVRIQDLTGTRISASEYASHNYIPEHNTLLPQVKQIISTMMKGDDVSSSDTRIAVEVAELAKENSGRVDVQIARKLQFPALKTDDNFIFLGSPYSNPWFSVFNDQLDFRITSDKDFVEIIRNVHPAPGEQAFYVPTARGGATGSSFAILAFIANPDQYGHVILLAGLSAEGTHAAGTLITDLPRLSAALQSCGIPSPGPLKHFEMLLRVNTMAGYSSQFEVVACHILTGTQAH
jgi:hypothetical protein